MDFNRRTQAPSAVPVTPQHIPTNSGLGPRPKNKRLSINGFPLNDMRKATAALLFSSTILIIALIFSIVLGSPPNEARYVDKNQLQSVFLANGQVYFGKITTLNDKFVRLNDIYYLRVNQQVQPNQATGQAPVNDVTLEKLGCELHGPRDEMIIIRDQVTFWENLKNDGQVAQAVAKFKKDFPKGRDCKQDTSSSNPASSTPTTNGTSSPTTNTTTPPVTPTTPSNNTPNR